VTRHPDYRAALDTYRYWWEGGAWLDQGQTGTCVGNAFAHRYADAPNPEVGIDEAWARALYVAASGDTTLQQGTSGLAACRELTKEGKISAYHWVTSADELRNTILALGSVCVGTNWYNSMFKPKLGLNSRAYMVVDKASGLAGGHEYVINGINLAPTSGPAYYRMKNSWGKQWPGDEISGTVYGAGTARFACTDLEELIFNENGDAVLITEV
jgi:hypothetical protein